MWELGRFKSKLHWLHEEHVLHGPRLMGHLRPPSKSAPACHTSKTQYPGMSLAAVILMSRYKIFL